jgi:hypothetical protein
MPIKNASIGLITEKEYLIIVANLGSEKKFCDLQSLSWRY